MKFRFWGVLVFLLALAPGSLLAQGIFQGSAVPVTVTATGQTEVIGTITVSMTSGPVAAGTLTIDLSPLKITNASVNDISVTSSGINLGTKSIDTDNNLVKVEVQAGASLTGNIIIKGIRVAVAGTGITSANAKLSFNPGSSDLFTAGTTVQVINAVKTGLVGQAITDPFIIFNNIVYRSTSTIHVAEGYESAFSNSSQFGQTNPTQIRIRVTDFPDGIQMSFPSSVTATETAATLTTGGSVTLPLSNGDTTLTYSFSKAGNSDTTIESFDVPFSISVVGAVSSIQPTIEVSLAPIGLATPTTALPSTAIPRYAEDEILEQAGSSRIVTKVLYWTGVNASLQNQVHLTNPSSRVANVTIDALDSTGQDISGSGVTNPVKLSISANQSVVKAVSDLFGTATGISTIRIQSTSSDLIAAAVVLGTNANAAVPFVSRAVSAPYFPVVTEGAQLQLMNPNTATVTGKLVLLSQDGNSISNIPVTLGPLASTTVAAQSAFTAIPQSGYVYGTFSGPVVAFESFGQNKLNLVAVQPPNETSTLYLPFVVGGSGNQTDVDLVNVSDQQATFVASLYNASGTRLGPLQLITMPAGSQLLASLQTIFGQAPASGYVRLDVPRLTKGFLSYHAAILGHARIQTSQGGSTAIPLAAPLADQFVIGDGQDFNTFEGIALANPNTSNVSVTLQALNLDGSVAATANITLTAGQLFSQVTTQLFSVALPTQSVIRITASAPITAAAITGTTAYDQFRSLPLLR